MFATNCVRPPLPDVAHLRLVSTAENSFTATWKKPEVSFDYYRIQVSDDSGDRSGLSEPHQNGSCATGTIIHPDQTQVTCSPLQPCTKASFTVRTYASGPPELTSLGVTLHDIFIPGQDPEPPGSITIIATSPSLTRLQWTPPTKFSGGIQSYAVKVCEEFTSCNTQASVAGCTEHQTSANWLEFASTADTPYCVLASVSVQCGFNVLSSRPAVEEFRTPSFVLPDVVNLRLVSTAANSFTASWDRPEARFDYYTIEVLNDKDQGIGPSEPQRLGSCASGVIIHPNQTVVTCTLLEACAKATLIVRTFRSGPPALTSLGVSLQGIFVPGEDPPPPRGLTMISKSPSLSKIQWQAPGNVPGNLVAFTAKVCTGYFSCDAQQTGSGCMEYETSDTWVEFESTGDTSYCVQVNARVRCGLDDISSVAMTADFRTALFELPDVTNLTLVATGDRSFTVRWERPDVLFDYYRVEVLSNYNERSPGGTEWRRGSSCAAGSIVHSDQTEVTCNFLETCTNVSFRLQTYRRGPPELASSGNILEGILITAEDPDPPRSISVVGISSSLTRLQWDPPTKVPKNILSYTVKVCDVFSRCDGVEPMTGCTERETSRTSLEIESMPDTLYCALVSTSALSRGDVLRSRPVTEEFRTPVFEITDVSNLTLISAADNSFTVAWERPADHFDYYRIEAKGGSNGVNESIGTPYVGSCARGTILHPDQNRVVCSYFDSCSVVSFTVHAYIKGPPEITSQGVTLSDIFIAGQEPEPPKSITMVALAPSITRLQWESPQKLPASVVFYTVMMCKDFASCSAQKNLTECIEHETFATWLEIETSVDTNYCVLLWATTRCGADLLRSRPEAAEFKTPMFVLPDVTNLRLESAGDHSFTATWQRPKALFDYYMIELASETDGGSSLRKPKQVGSCASGTIVHPNHTRVTCNLLEACSEASLTVRTYSRGPPELFSLGVTLHNVFIPGKDPDPPRSVGMFGLTPSLTSLQWQSPQKISGSTVEYTVNVCELFTSCDAQETLSGCIEHETSSTSLEFESTADKRYCVLVTATTLCGSVILRSRPEAALFRTPLFELPEVVNLTLVYAADSSFTVQWQRPEGRFDYYRIEVSDENKNSSGHTQPQRMVSCASGTIIHPAQTKVTCTSLDACSTASFTVRTFTAGPPELLSLGATINNIFIPGQGPDPPESIHIARSSLSLARLEWKPPGKVSGSIISYTLKVCDEFTVCIPEGNVSGCTEYESSERWLEFKSVSDTKYCVLATASAQCGRDILWSRPTAVEIRTPLFALRDVATLRLVSAGDRSFTVSWKRPETRFDYYKIEATGENGYANRDVVGHRAGSCSKGTILQPDQTRVTCGQFKACTTASFTVRTYRQGPPELTSTGVTLSDVFIPSQGLGSPQSITMDVISTSLTRLRWEAPANVSGTLAEYTVEICDTFTACDVKTSLTGCIRQRTPVTSLEFHSTMD
ncbi:tenascin-X-like [Amblyomma americanum]